MHRLPRFRRHARLNHTYNTLPHFTLTGILRHAHYSYHHYSEGFEVTVSCISRVYHVHDPDSLHSSCDMCVLLFQKPITLTSAHPIPTLTSTLYFLVTYTTTHHLPVCYFVFVVMCLGIVIRVTTYPHHADVRVLGHSPPHLFVVYLFYYSFVQYTPVKRSLYNWWDSYVPFGQSRGF